jgi:hypothetical protein
VGFVVDKVALGQVFSKFFNFPTNIIPPWFHTHISSRGWTIDPLVAPDQHHFTPLTSTWTESQSQWPCSVRHRPWLLRHWDCGFKFCLRHGCLFLSILLLLLLHHHHHYSLVTLSLTLYTVTKKA